MAELGGDTTCAIHPRRQAGARCPGCRQYFCAECITEHDGRLICASCLAAGQTERRKRRSPRLPLLAVLSTFLQVLVALVACWLIFYLFGQTLGDMPDDFHDGTIWE